MSLPLYRAVVAYMEGGSVTPMRQAIAQFRAHLMHAPWLALVGMHRPLARVAWARRATKALIEDMMREERGHAVCDRALQQGLLKALVRLSCDTDVFEPVGDVIEHRPFRVRVFAGVHDGYVSMVFDRLDKVARKVPARFAAVLYGEICVMSPSVAALNPALDCSAGVYDNAYDTIFIIPEVAFGQTECEGITGTLLHELGHRYAYRFADQTAYQAFLDLSAGQPAKSANAPFWRRLKKTSVSPMAVSPYGATSPTENFAEAFMLYALGLPFPPGTEALRDMIEAM